jgi:HD superfamily phosphohydrolase
MEFLVSDSPSTLNPGSPCLPDCSEAPDLWEAVLAGYKAEALRGQSEFDAERGSLEEAIRLFRAQTDERYSVESFLGVGATGLVFRVCDQRLSVRRALKIARPLEGRAALTEGLLIEEIGMLQEVSHPNVMGIFDRGIVQLKDASLPFYVMSYVRGAVSAKRFFEARRTRDDLITTLLSITRGIKHLHGVGVLHLDLKPSNFFIAPDGNGVVADLGGARKITGDPDDELLITCTRQYAHPELLRYTGTPTNVNRVRGNIRRGELRVQFDLFALGRSIFELVQIIDKYSTGVLDSYTRKYLHLMAARLLDAQNEQAELSLGLTKSAYRELCYSTIDEIEYDLLKLLGTAKIETEVEELAPFASSGIQASTLGWTAYTPRVAALLNEPLVSRLAGVSQLGLLNLVYPTASHTRMDHALGTYSNTGQYLYALYHDPINPLFRQIMNPPDIRATLVAAFLHDLGQYPLAHDLEGANRAIFNHEALTLALIKNERVDLKAVTESLIRRVEADWKVSISRVISIYESKPSQLEKPIKDRLLHCVISGPIDADKLDYLVRDGRQCQVPFARVIDFARLVRTLTVVYQKVTGEKQYIALGIHEKGRVAAECVAYARYAMFAQVYWHHAARSAKAMLQRAVWEWLSEDKRNNDTKKTELHQFLLKRARGRQLSMLDDDPSPRKEEFEPSIHPEWSQIHAGDRAMISWVHSKTSRTGKRLLEMLARRSLYKRVAVISETKNPLLWKRLQKVGSDGESIRGLSDKLQTRLLAVARKEMSRIQSGEVKVHLTGMEPSELDSALEALALDGAVLIDIPMPRDSENDVLHYYPEEMHRHQREEFAHFPTLEDSKVWRLLAEDLHMLAGKIRIFVHPAIMPLAHASVEGKEESILGQSTVESELDGATSS